MRKFLTTSAMAVGALALMTAPAANAAATLAFSINGGAPIFCADGDACDANVTAGVVTFIGPLPASPFVVNVTTGISKPTFTGNPVLMDLNSVNVQTEAGDNTLFIGFSDTGFTGGGDIKSLFGGTLTGGAGASVQSFAWWDASDALFGFANAAGSVGPFGPGAFGGTASGAGPLGGTFSLTQGILLQTSGPTSYSGDFEISRVPEPASISLLGGVLLAAGAAIRRKMRPAA